MKYIYIKETESYLPQQKAIEIFGHLYKVTISE